MQANEKGDSTLVTSGEETFEFSPVRQLDGDRVVANVRNNSHDAPGEHIYPVFFQQEGAGIKAVACGCPADEYHGGHCKHREAASECGELLGRVRSVATDGGVTVEEIDRVRDDDGVEWIVEDTAWIKRDDGQIEEDIWFADRQALVDAIAAGEYVPVPVDGDKKAIADGGECSLCKSLPGGAQCWSCVRDEDNEVDD